jgi:hypothetical protein
MRHKAYSPIHGAPSTKSDAKRASGSKVTAFQVHEQGQCIYMPICEVAAEYEPPPPPICLIGALESCLGVYDHTVDSNSVGRFDQKLAAQRLFPSLSSWSPSCLRPTSWPHAGWCRRSFVTASGNAPSGLQPHPWRPQHENTGQTGQWVESYSILSLCARKSESPEPKARVHRP